MVPQSRGAAPTGGTTPHQLVRLGGHEPLQHSAVGGRPQLPLTAQRHLSEARQIGGGSQHAALALAHHFAVLGGVR